MTKQGSCLSEFRVGDTVRLDFVVTSLDYNVAHLRRWHLDGLHKSSDTYLNTAIFVDDPTVEHVPKPRTVEVGQKYASTYTVNNFTYTVLYIHDDMAFVQISGIGKSEYKAQRCDYLLTDHYTLIE